jgi:(R,R)-butanediol dehydrogenase/meso-butanediol dehydrogenase/diacetyl reductase
VKAAITAELHGFDIVELPDPTPGPDEVVIRVTACGICGSDIKAQPYMPAGMIMGHELGGEIVGFGSEAGGWRVGTNVAVLPVVSCGRCRYCLAGLAASSCSKRCRPVGNSSATVHPEVSQTACAVLRQQFDRGIT